MARNGVRWDFYVHLFSYYKRQQGRNLLPGIFLRLRNYVCRAQTATKKI